MSCPRRDKSGPASFKLIKLLSMFLSLVHGLERFAMPAWLARVAIGVKLLGWSRSLPIAAVNKA